MVPVRHENRQILTLNGVAHESMLVYEIYIDSLDGQVQEKIEVTGSKMRDFTTVHWPNINKLKGKYQHTLDRRFYRKPGEEYQMHIILGDSTYCRIKTEEVFMGQPGEPIVEGTTFG